MSQAVAYMRSDEIWSLNGAVADTVGATDSDYTNEWLVDARPSWPAKATTGTVTWTITNTAGPVNGIVICNHNLDVASVAVSGGVTATVTVPTNRPNSIKRSAFKAVTLVASVTSVAVAISGNSAAVTIGGVYIGKTRAFPYTGFAVRGLSKSEEDFRSDAGGAGSFMMPYDNRTRMRIVRGTTVCTTSELDDLIAWQESQRGGSLPSILVMDDTANDALVGYMSLTYESVANASDLWEAVITFREHPRTRW